MSKQIALSHFLVSFALLLFTTNLASQELSPYVDANGNISNPQNVEDTWSHLGAYFVQDLKDQQAFDMHQVYIQKQYLDFFRKTGTFKDGTVLVKRVFGTTSKVFTTGKGYFATDPKVTFVMVKASQNTF